MSKLSSAILASSSLLLLSSFEGQTGETPTVEDLINKLQDRGPAPGAGKPGAGKLSAGSSTSGQRDGRPNIQGGRDLTSKERRDVAETVRRDGLPTADLEVYFDFDSAAITPAAFPVLKTLGQALTDGRLSGGTFIVGGHTDAKGEADYNQGLSQRRAQAVREFLVANFPIPPAKLMAVDTGRNSSKLRTSPWPG